MRSPRTVVDDFYQQLGRFIAAMPEGATLKLSRRKEGWYVNLDLAGAGQAVGRGVTLAAAWKGPAAFAAA